MVLWHHSSSTTGLIDKARARRELLDAESVFGRTFEDSEALQLWKSQRDAMASIESQDLITQLNLLGNSESIPLNEYGLDSAPDLEQVRAAFPQLSVDPLESQAALAYLLIKNNVSSAVTLGPGLSPLVGLSQIVDSPPLAFDFSHSAHRATQAVMWNRILNVADRLIGLLKGAEYAAGESYWDRSMIYVATDFGRTKTGANAPEFPRVTI